MQNGKTFLLEVLALYWLFVEEVSFVLGTSTNLQMAREAWEKSVLLVEGRPWLLRRIARTRRANGEQTLELDHGGRYRIAASNRSAARGLTVNRLILDELREHDSYDALDAALPTTITDPSSQTWMISNAGDDRSLVLNELRAQALEGTDRRLGIFEWSSPDGAAATNLEALAQANPNLGRRISAEYLLGEAERAERIGGEQLTGFLTEHHCRNVPIMAPAIDMEAWHDCLEVGSLEGLKGSVALCVEVSWDSLHASLYAAALGPDGRIRVDAVDAWAGMDCTQQLRLALPRYLERITPRKLGWFPNGPAASLTADMAFKSRAGIEIEAVKGDMTAVCMGFAEQIKARQIVHSGDPLLEAHLMGAEKLMQGDGWRFSRKNAGHCDAAYAAAGAVYLARVMPPKTEPRIFTRS